MKRRQRAVIEFELEGIAQKEGVAYKHSYLVFIFHLSYFT